MMFITLSESAAGTTLELRHPAPVPPALRSCLFMFDSTLFSMHRPDSDWEETENEAGLTMRRELAGIWGMDCAIRFCHRLDDGLGFALALHEAREQSTRDKVTRENSPKYPLSFCFAGQDGLTLHELDKVYESQPPKAYALGSFELTQPTLRVTDPCYQTGTWCAHTLQAQPGRWNAKVLAGPTSWHARVHLLQIAHESLGDVPVLDVKELQPTELNAGVDSGQCGFFDDARYPRDEASFEYEDDTFYGRCCESTLNDMLPGGAAVDNMGVVSRSGFGDGGYDVYVRRNEEGQAIIVTLLFINESDEEEATEEDEAAQS